MAFTFSDTQLKNFKATYNPQGSAAKIAALIKRARVKGEENINNLEYTPLHDISRFIHSNKALLKVLQAIRKEYEARKFEELKAEKQGQRERLNGDELAAFDKQLLRQARNTKPKKREIVKTLSPLLPVVVFQNDDDNTTPPLHFYNFDKAVYTTNSNLFNILIETLAPNCNIFDRREVFKEFEFHAPMVNECTNLIPAKNGNIAIKNGEPQLLPPTPFEPFRNRLAVNFNPAAVDEPSFNGWQLSEWFKDLAQGDKDAENNLFFAVRCAIDPQKSPNKALFIVDEKGRTGKSTFQRLIINLVGQQNMATINIKDFGSQFSLASAVNKRLIMGDENDAKNITETANFKSVVTKDFVKIEQKGEPRYSTRLNAFVIQLMNELPTFSDKTGGPTRRIHIMRFTKQYPDTPEGRKIKDDYINRPELLEWLLNKALALDLTMFTETEASKKELDEFEQENNPVYSFYLNEWAELTSTRLPADLIYYYFEAVQINNGRTGIFTRNRFARELFKYIERDGGGWIRKKARAGDKTTPQDTATINAALNAANKGSRHIYPEDLQRSTICYIKLDK